jgi:hypothetical protein
MLSAATQRGASSRPTAATARTLRPDLAASSSLRLHYSSRERSRSFDSGVEPATGAAGVPGSESGAADSGAVAAVVRLPSTAGTPAGTGGRWGRPTVVRGPKITVRSTPMNRRDVLDDTIGRRGAGDPLRAARAEVERLRTGWQQTQDKIRKMRDESIGQRRLYAKAKSELLERDALIARLRKHLAAATNAGRGVASRGGGRHDEARNGHASSIPRQDAHRADNAPSGPSAGTEAAARAARRIVQLEESVRRLSDRGRVLRAEKDALVEDASRLRMRVAEAVAERDDANAALAMERAATAVAATAKNMRTTEASPNADIDTAAADRHVVAKAGSAEAKSAEEILAARQAASAADASAREAERAAVAEVRVTEAERHAAALARRLAAEEARASAAERSAAAEGERASAAERRAASAGDVAKAAARDAESLRDKLAAVETDAAQRRDAAQREIKSLREEVLVLTQILMRRKTLEAAARASKVQDNSVVGAMTNVVGTGLGPTAGAAATSVTTPFLDLQASPPPSPAPARKALCVCTPVRSAAAARSSSPSPSTSPGATRVRKRSPLRCTDSKQRLIVSPLPHAASPTSELDGDFSIGRVVLRRGTKSPSLERTASKRRLTPSTGTGGASKDIQNTAPRVSAGFLGSAGPSVGTTNLSPTLGLHTGIRPPSNDQCRGVVGDDDDDAVEHGAAELGRGHDALLGAEAVARARGEPRAKLAAPTNATTRNSARRYVPRMCGEA